MTEMIEMGKIHSEYFARNVYGWSGATAIIFFGGLMIAWGQQPLAIPIPVAIGMIWFGLATLLTPKQWLLREEGLEVRQFFRKPKFMKFSDCLRVYRLFSSQSVPLNDEGLTGYTLKLVDSRNQKLYLNPISIRDPENLFVRLERLIVFPKHQAIRDNFNEGKTIDFGPIRVNRKGIQIRRKHTGWEDIREIKIYPKVMIFIFHHRLRRSLSLKKIPFPFALLKIIRYHKIKINYFGGLKAP